MKIIYSGLQQTKTMSYHLDSKNLLTKSSKTIFGRGSKFERTLSEYAAKTGRIDTEKQYNSIIKNLINISKKFNFPSKKSHLYDKEIAEIKKSAPLTEKTAWGGVSLKKVDVNRNYIRKLLVIGKCGVLGFEIHKMKHERLKILEGLCIVLYSNHEKRNWEPSKISIKVGTEGDEFEFLPRDEHGIVALTNSVIEEKSTNHLDDLTYIFVASQV